MGCRIYAAALFYCLIGNDNFTGRYGERGPAGPAELLEFIRLKITVYVRNQGIDHISGSIIITISSKNIKYHKYTKNLLTYAPPCFILCLQEM